MASLVWCEVPSRNYILCSMSHYLETLPGNGTIFVLQWNLRPQTSHISNNSDLNKKFLIFLLWRLTKAQTSTNLNAAKQYEIGWEEPSNRLSHHCHAYSRWFWVFVGSRWCMRWKSPFHRGMYGKFPKYQSLIGCERKVRGRANSILFGICTCCMDPSLTLLLGIFNSLWKQWV